MDIKTGIKDNRNRRFPGVGGRRHNPAGVTARRKVAAENKEAAEKRTPLEQLSRLDARRCEAKRERARLQAKLATIGKAVPEARAADSASPAKPRKKAKERRAEAR